jgi:hypothetical protein
LVGARYDMTNVNSTLFQASGLQGGTLMGDTVWDVARCLTLQQHQCGGGIWRPAKVDRIVGSSQTGLRP